MELNMSNEKTLVVLGYIGFFLCSTAFFVFFSSFAFGQPWYCAHPDTLADWPGRDQEHLNMHGFTKWFPFEASQETHLKKSKKEQQKTGNISNLCIFDHIWVQTWFLKSWCTHSKDLKRRFCSFSPGSNVTHGCIFKVPLFSHPVVVAAGKGQSGENNLLVPRTGLKS